MPKHDDAPAGSAGDERAVAEQAGVVVAYRDPASGGHLETDEHGQQQRQRVPQGGLHPAVLGDPDEDRAHSAQDR